MLIGSDLGESSRARRETPSCAGAHKALSNAAMRRLSKFRGGLAQLGEHLLCKQGVVGSIPSSSTIHTCSGWWINAVPISVNRKQ
jgi:hypothetical protein